MNTNKLALDLLKAMQADMQNYLLPDGKTSVNKFACQMIGHLDGPQQREVQAALEAVQVEPPCTCDPDVNHWCRDSHAPPAPSVQVEPVAWTEAHIDEYLEDYEMRGEDESGREGCYTPNENDKALIKDAMMGFTSFVPFAAPQEPAVNSELLEVLTAMCDEMAGRNWGIKSPAQWESKNYQAARAAIAKAEKS